MKKIVFLILCTVFIVACGDNNKGPFFSTYVDGEKVLLSGDKPASGEVEFPIILEKNNMKVIAWKAQLKNGIVDGEAVAYSRKNKVMFRGTFIRKESDLYDVNITLANGSVKGTIKISSEEIFELLEMSTTQDIEEPEKINLRKWFMNRLVDGVIETPDSIIKKKDDEIEEVLNDKEKDIKVINSYRNGEQIGYKEYTKKDTLILAIKILDDNKKERISYNEQTGKMEEYVLSNLREGKTIKEYSNIGDEMSYYRPVLDDDDPVINSGKNPSSVEIQKYLKNEGYITLMFEDYSREIWTIPSNINLTLEECDELFYEIIASNKAQKKGNQRLLNKMRVER